MKRRIGILCMILGAVLVLGALSLFLWNQNEDRRAGNAVEKILPQIVENIETIVDDEKGYSNSYSTKISEEMSEPGENEVDENIETIVDDEKRYLNPYSTGMPGVKIDGDYYIGYLSIPSLSLELPVMSSWSYPKLRIAPCRYYGSVQTGDLVIAAHNYSRHFGNIKKLSLGDPVYFTDMNGGLWTYKVVELDILAPVAVREMTDGGYDLTLFTCTYGGGSRITVRCDQME